LRRHSLTYLPPVAKALHLARGFRMLSGLAGLQFFQQNEFRRSKVSRVEHGIDRSGIQYVSFSAELDFFLMAVRARRLDDHIRELCAEAVLAKNSMRVKSILAELQSAIHQYTYRLRSRAAAVFIGQTEIPFDRRDPAAVPKSNI